MTVHRYFRAVGIALQIMFSKLHENRLRIDRELAMRYRTILAGPSTLFIKIIMLLNKIALHVHLSDRNVIQGRYRDNSSP